MKAMLTGMRNGVPDLRLDIENMVAEGDAVVTRFTMRGTHTGSMMGRRPRGRSSRSGGRAFSSLYAGSWTGRASLT